MKEKEPRHEMVHQEEESSENELREGANDDHTKSRACILAPGCHYTQ